MVVAKVMWFDRVAVLLIGLALMLALGGCGGRAAIAPQDKPSQSRAMPTEIELQPTNDSGVKGVAIITNTDGKVRVRLTLRGLPEPDKMYLAHIYPGTCEDEDPPMVTSTPRQSTLMPKSTKNERGAATAMSTKGTKGASPTTSSILWSRWNRTLKAPGRAPPCSKAPSWANFLPAIRTT